MSKQLNNREIAKKNIENKPVRNYSLMALTGFLCFVLFLSTFLIYSVKNGLHSLSDRMGADIIVVPEGYDSKISGAILRGEPNSFFFERSIFERLQKIEGIEKIYDENGKLIGTITFENNQIMEEVTYKDGKIIDQKVYPLGKDLEN